MSRSSEPIVGREISGTPSVPGSAFFKTRYLDSPLMVDIEYIRHLTDSHRLTDGMEVLERRATDHAYALSKMTAVIHQGDTLAGQSPMQIMQRSLF